jgi:hypothetical protein
LITWRKTAITPLVEKSYQSLGAKQLSLIWRKSAITHLAQNSYHSLAQLAHNSYHSLGASYSYAVTLEKK